MSELKILRERLGLSQTEVAVLCGYSPKTIYRWETGETTTRRAAIETLQRVLRERPSPPYVGSPRFRFIDLFAGIGGMRLGFESVGGECVFTSEWDEYAQRTYRANFGESHPIAGDIRQVPSELIPQHDVLLAGFPCQPFSIAGVSKKNALGRPHGFACETQGTLFFDVARIIKDHRPKAFLLENVKNLLSHDKGRTWTTIRNVLTEELGYYIDWRILDAKGFVPQHRERIYIAGFRDLTEFSFKDMEFPDPLRGPKLASILHPENGSEAPEDPFTDSKGKVSRKYVLTDGLWNYLRAYADKHRSMGNGFGFGLVGSGDTTRTLSARYYKDGSEILVKRGRGNPRRLTPRECARLMGFDGQGRAPFQITVSDTRAYKQFGNAVVVPVVEAVARHMVPCILGTNTRASQLVLALARAS
ncbi:MAG: DNA (cytosine-5-)-methyltransferase [Gemmatimonadota bacterium]|nr:DNA (cytosine-5-)-methyltransferase [Gemmatimonadota bacterium]